MADKRIMFCCEECADNYPEGCGYFDRSELRVMPNDKWLCDSCFYECDAYDYGFRDRDEDGDIVKPDWADLPVPPALIRADLVEQMAAALRIISGRQQCIDNLMSKADVANAALQAYEAAILCARQTEARG